MFPHLTKVSQQEGSICPTTSSLQASLCSLSLPHGKAAELKALPLFPSAAAGDKSQGGITTRRSSPLEKRGYNDTFISKLQSPVHHASGSVVVDSLESSLGSHGAWAPNPYILSRDSMCSFRAAPEKHPGSGQQGDHLHSQAGQSHQVLPQEPTRYQHKVSHRFAEGITLSARWSCVQASWTWLD